MPEYISTYYRVARNCKPTESGYYIVVKNGWMDVIYGSTIGVTISSGGSQCIMKDGSDRDSYVSAGGIQEVEYMGVATGVTLSGASGMKAEQKVAKGGQASETRIYSDGVQTVLGSSYNTNIYSGGSQYVFCDLSLGNATNVTIHQGGFQRVNNGGEVYDVVVMAGGMQEIGSRGYAYNVTVSSGGIQIVSSGGYVDGGRIYSGACHDVKAGARVSNLIIDSGAILDVDGFSFHTTVESGGSQIIESGGQASSPIISGVQTISSGGNSISGTIVSDGNQIVLTGGIASNTIISGVQTLNGGEAISAHIQAGGSQIITGGKSISGTILSNGSQIVSANGVASKTTISGVQIVSTGGEAISAHIQAGGSQIIAGGKSVNGTVLSNGSQIVSASGVASNTMISGVQLVSNGGKEILANIQAGGRQIIVSGSSISGTILSGGSQIISASGIASNTIISGVQTVSTGGVSISAHIQAGGSQIISGGSSLKGTVLAGGRQTVEKGKVSSDTIKGTQTVMTGGEALGAVIYKGGIQAVHGGVAKQCSVVGGKQIIYSGTASGTTIHRGGSAVVYNNARMIGGKIAGTLFASSRAVISSITLSSGGVLRAQNGVTLYGKNTISNASVSGGNGKNISVADVLSLGGKASIKGATLNLNKGSLVVSGVANTVQALSLKAASNIVFDITSVNVTAKTAMLNIAKQAKAGDCKISIAVKNTQACGKYELEGNLVVLKNKPVSIKLAGKTLGYAKFNSSPLNKGGVSYAVKAPKTEPVYLLVSAIKGLLRKGVAKKPIPAGTSNCDIFYGGSGSEKIIGSGGRDVAVYGARGWGKDEIIQAAGTMTILFTGVAKKDITVKNIGKDKVITRKGAKSESITVRGWNDATHNIVYGGKLTAFSKYLASSKPSTLVQDAARKEVWSKTGLLA